MSSKCQMVVFSNKAYNAIIRESFDKDPVETGGILLGHILDNGVWIVMEVLPPGINCIFERAYFEYDDDFVNYLAQSVANQYKIPLELLGLWHRHPGSMDVFSSTDDGTNTTFALQNPSGVISGLVNIDPQFRLTMYYMENPRNVVRQYHRPNYECIDVEVGDDIIPEEYFQLKYYDGEGSNLNPFVERSHTRMSRSVRTEGSGHRTSNDASLDIHGPIERNLNSSEAKYESHNNESSCMRDLTKIWDIVKKNKIMSLIAMILVVVSIFSFKQCSKDGVITVISWLSDDDKKEPHISKDEISLMVGDNVTLTTENVAKNDIIRWRSSDRSLASVDENGKVLAKKEGEVGISLIVNGKYVDSCKIEIKAKSREDKTLKHKLSAEEITLDVNEKEILTLVGVEDASEIKWTSTDNSVATVNNGEVIAIQAGTTKISASIAGKSYECKVLVKEEEVKIQIPSFRNSKQGVLSLSDMSTYSLNPQIIGNAVKELIQFSSDKPEVASITNTGVVTMKAVGTVKITVSYNGKEQDTFMLTINQ